jgi:hypothetical protein
MNNDDDMKSLNLTDLDVEGLERRLELVEPIGDTAAAGYYCGTDCGTYIAPSQ